MPRGEIDALIGSRKPDSFGRNPDVVRLLPNYRALERELYETKKIFPIMHLVAIKKSLYERHRWLASSFYKAFVEVEGAGAGAHALRRIALDHVAVAP